MGEGEYTYWVDGPIWMFGDSRTFYAKENKEYESIINDLASHFSPSITLGADWFGKTVEARLSIIENHNEWKEVKFSVDRYDVLDSYDTNQRDEIILCLCNIFTNIVSGLMPYYGCGAAEVYGVVESPEVLVVEENNLGDMNYFSNEAAKQLDLQKFKQTFKIEHLGNVGVLLIIRKGLMELG
ncbi:hypothetical protein [Sporomusa aerivorans]|uniref:hypothetical protein n=1 Tax=Sporomusa aerivorans TaxID=204936 RepID=UPI00352B827C